MDREDRVLSLLPDDGSEIAYEAWRDSIPPSDRQAINVLRRNGRVEFRLDTSGDYPNVTVNGHLVRKVVA